MKKVLVLCCAFLIISSLLSCAYSKEIEESKLQERNGVYYEINQETPYTGIVYSNYDNGQRELETTVKDGKIKGRSTLWYKNGQKQQENIFIDEKNGRQTTWYENGQKKSEGKIKDDKVDGVATYWHENGQKAGVADWKDGKEIGVIRYNKDGTIKLKRGIYKDK